MGADGGYPGGGGASSSRIRALIAGLASGDEGAALAALAALNDLLSVANEDSAAGLPLDALASSLVPLLAAEHSPDLMLLAARAVTYLADAAPPAAGALLRAGAAAALAERLGAVAYIDLAEQCLAALDRLAADHPRAVLSAGGMGAALGFIDFFPTGGQRAAAGLAAKMARGLTLGGGGGGGGGGPPAADVELAIGAVPLLAPLLHSGDARVVESGVAALGRVGAVLAGAAAAGSAEAAAAFGSAGLLASALQLTATPGASGPASSIYFGLIRLLGAAGAASGDAAAAILDGGGLATVTALLSTSPLLCGRGADPAGALRSPDHLAATVGLAASILPPVADPVAVVAGGLAAGAPPPGEGAGASAAARGVAFSATPGSGAAVAALLPHLIAAHDAAAAADLRAGCVGLAAAALAAAPPADLLAALADTPACSWVASLLRARDPAAVAGGVVLAEALHAKLPEACGAAFPKEGVLAALQRLAGGGGGAGAAGGTTTAGGTPPAAAATTTRASSRLRSRRGTDDSQPGSAGGAAAGPPPPPSPGGLRSAAAARAALLLASAFPGAAGDGVGGGGGTGLDTAGAAALREAVAALDGAGGDAGAARAAFAHLLALTAGGGPGGRVSTHELLASGAVPALRSFLQGADLATAPGGAAALTARLAAVLDAGRAALAGQQQQVQAAAPAEPALGPLVRALLDALVATERFPVSLGGGGGGGGSAAAAGPSAGLGGGGGGSGRFGGGGPSGSTAPPGSLSAGLAALAQPLKLRLVREDGRAGAGLRDIGAAVVLVEPLATLAAVEDFLWPRVAPPPPAPPQAAREGGGGRGGRAGVAAPPARSAGTGPASARRLTRAAAAARAEAGGAGPSSTAPAPAARCRRLRAATADANGDAAMADAAEEDEDEEDEDYDDGDAMDAEAAAAGAVFGGEDEEEDEDEDGDGTSDEEGFAFDEDDEFEGAAAAAEAAAAAAAALVDAEAAAAAGGGGRSYAGVAAAARPRLRFKAVSGGGGRPVRADPTSTVFQAVQASAARAASAAGGPASEEAPPPLSGRRLWEVVHTVSYGLAPAEGEEGAEGEEEGEGGRAGTPAAAAAAAPSPADAAWLASLSGPVSAVAGAGPPPGLPLTSPDAADVLAVLGALHALNAGAARVAAAAGVAAGAPLPPGVPLPRPPLPASAFSSPRLASRLALALQDALAVCGGALPPWVAPIVGGGAAWLVPPPLRAHWVRCTAFGLGRALAALQAGPAGGGGGLGGDPPGGGGGGASGDGGGSGDGGSRGGGVTVGRLQRVRLRVPRSAPLGAAARALRLHARSRAMLEFEFAGEPGTGLGPTLEWYASVSAAFTAPGTGLWRGDPAAPGAGGAPRPLAADDEASARSGGPPPALAGDLFPAPLPPGEAHTARSAPVPSRFRTLGRLAGRALLDGRLLADLPAAPAFWRAVATGGGGGNGTAAPSAAAALGPLGLYDIRAFDPSLGAALEGLAAAADAVAAGRPATVGGATLADLGLAWEVPGYPAYPLPPPPGSASPPDAVDEANVGAYVAAVVDATVGAGITPAVEAFRAGFADAAPLAALAPFGPAETDALLCGVPGAGPAADAAWSRPALAAAIRFDHGYSATSAVASHFLDALASFTPPQRAAFLRFATGAPRLPPGGLAGLHPRLTVVRKHPAAGGGGGGGGGGDLGTSLGTSLGGGGPGGGGGTPSSFVGAAAFAAASAPGGGGAAFAGLLPGPPGPADGDLPSVMTCANYIKLPPYSSAAVARDRLLYAVAEGQGSFDLS